MNQHLTFFLVGWTMNQHLTSENDIVDMYYRTHNIYNSFTWSMQHYDELKDVLTCAQDHWIRLACESSNMVD